MRLYPLVYRVKKIKCCCSGYILHIFFISLICIFSKYGWKKGVPFALRAEHQAAFDRLKQALSEAPVLQVPDFRKEVLSVTDASDLVVSAILHQRLSDG